jgi:hypothetical protein
MGASTEDLRQDIERTRSDLGETIDAIEDRVSPGRVIERRRNRIVHSVASMRDRAMGTAHDAAAQLEDVPAEARRRTEGAPMLTGTLAFGVGLLTAALLPTTEAERSAGGGALADKARPLKEGLMDAGREVGQHLAEPAKESAEAIKEAAGTGAREVAAEARPSRGDAVESARSASERIRSES